MDQNARDRIAPIFRNMRIIAAALFLGSTTCLGVAAWLGRARPKAANAPGAAFDPMTMIQNTPLTVVALAMSAGCGIAVYVLLPALFTAQWKRALDATAGDPRSFPRESPSEIELAQMLLSQAIVRGALLEGAVFMCGIAHFIEGGVLSLVVGAVLCGLLACQIPTFERAVRWIEAKREDLSAGPHFRPR